MVRLKCPLKIFLKNHASFYKYLTTLPQGFQTYPKCSEQIVLYCSLYQSSCFQGLAKGCQKIPWFLDGYKVNLDLLYAADPARPSAAPRFTHARFPRSFDGGVLAKLLQRGVQGCMCTPHINRKSVVAHELSNSTL